MNSNRSSQDTRMDSSQERSDENNAAVRKRRIKSHRKSRAGCLACKTRKVKCCEKKPRCDNCIKMGDECVYGVPRDTQKLAKLQSPQPVNATGFTMLDLRYFHAFITASYPSFPFETDRAWTCDIPLIAQQFPFLNDAILALGAGHLHATTNLDVAQTVQNYRFSAIQGINSEDNFDLPSSLDLNSSDRATAVLAACYALAFTSLHMGDPIENFLVLVRGCSTVTRRIVEAGFSSPLFPADEVITSPKPHMDVMRRRLGNAACLPPEICAAARDSMDLAEQSCEFLPFEQDILDRMRSVVAITSGPIEAFNNYSELWNDLTDMGPENFQYFMGTPRLTILVLQAHFLALEVVVRPWLQAKHGFRGGDSKLLRHTLQQFPCESATVDAELSLRLVSWPQYVLDESAMLSEADLRARVFCPM